MPRCPGQAPAFYRRRKSFYSEPLPSKRNAARFRHALTTWPAAGVGRIARHNRSRQGAPYRSLRRGFGPVPIAEVARPAE